MMVLLHYTLMCCMVCVKEVVSPPLAKKMINFGREQQPVSPDDGSSAAYSHYLQEVATLLDSDDKFISKIKHVKHQLERNGSVSLRKIDLLTKQLDFVHYRVRDKLDNLKMMELHRLNEAEKLLQHQKNAASGNPTDPVLKYDGVGLAGSDHLDHSSTRFTPDDLRRLIRGAGAHLRRLDAEAETEWRQYEMGKALLQERRLRQLGNGTAQRAAAERAASEAAQRHRAHQPLHHPGSEAQLKTVWALMDHLDSESFDPKTFFKLHDTNGDGFWDYAEIEALFQVELDKVYAANNTDDDMNDRYHEMMKMRQEMLEHADRDEDSRLSEAEFLGWTKSRLYKKDDAWKTSEEEGKAYNDEEMKSFNAEYKKDLEDEEDKEDGQKKGAASEKEAHDNPSEHQQQQPDAHADDAAAHHDQPSADTHSEPPVHHDLATDDKHADSAHGRSEKGYDSDKHSDYKHEISEKSEKSSKSEKHSDDRHGMAEKSEKGSKSEKYPSDKVKINVHGVRKEESEKHESETHPSKQGHHDITPKQDELPDKHSPPETHQKPPEQPSGEGSHQAKIDVKIEGKPVKTSHGKL